MYNIFFKRLLDIVFGLCALPFVILVLAIFAPIIYFNDKGPIFYNATRIGKNGKTYKMYKLRSMKVNAPDIRNEDGSTFNGDDDLRITRIGKFMRKTSLDEFPQFLNVLKGDMSIIGPRPNVPTVPLNELPQIEQDRLQVKPGITGYNQAYFRNSVSPEEKYKNDVYYINHLSLRMDLRVFFKTISSVIFRKNIYN